MHGYHQRYYRVDLHRQRLDVVPLPAEWLAGYVGGVGLGTRILLAETNPQADPLSPGAAFVLALSPLVGTPLTTSAKFAVVAKSPLTDRLNDSLSSSRFAMAAKSAGMDGLVVTGASDQWLVLFIDDGRLQILDASDYLGLTPGQTEAQLKSRLGPDVSVLSIGRAGENLVRYASVSNEGRHAGRGGMGAVLGSKRVKAVVVRGSHRVTLADPDRVVAIGKQLSEKSLGPATLKYREMGTVTNLLTFNRLGILPTRNFQESGFEQAEQISGEQLSQMPGKIRASCAACTIGCEHIFPTRRGGVRLEYESLFALGTLCGIGDRDLILEAARRCDELGLDTISLGGTFAFGCECVQRGLLRTPEDVELRFGNGVALLQAIELTARREGTGRALAEGSRRWARKIGGEALDFAPQVKGLEIPGYDPRTVQLMGLGFAVNTRGADHNRSGAYEADLSGVTNRFAAAADDVVHLVETENRSALLDSLILCKFVRGVFDDLFAECAEMLQAVTGQPLTGADLRAVGRDVVLLKRRFNELAGWTLAEDVLPRRFHRGANAIDPNVFRELRNTYYQRRGLDADGRLASPIPT